MAPQLMPMKGLSRRPLAAWMARATSSLPVPDSPVTEDRGRGARDLADLIFQLEHGGRAPDEVFDAGKGVPEGRDAIRHARQGLEGEDRGKMVVRRRERGHLAHERVLAAPGGDHEVPRDPKRIPRSV